MKHSFFPINKLAPCSCLILEDCSMTFGIMQSITIYWPNNNDLGRFTTWSSNQESSKVYTLFQSRTLLPRFIDIGSIERTSNICLIFRRSCTMSKKLFIVLKELFLSRGNDKGVPNNFIQEYTQKKKKKIDTINQNTRWIPSPYHFEFLDRSCYCFITSWSIPPYISLFIVWHRPPAFKFHQHA